MSGRVRFENVSFGYRSLETLAPVLHGISFEAEPGQVFALLGPTGSGKSTVISLIPRFYDPTGGRITIDGIDIRNVTLNSLRSQIGIVMQETTLFSGTVRVRDRLQVGQGREGKVIAINVFDRGAAAPRPGRGRPRPLHRRRSARGRADPAGRGRS